MKIGVVSDTHSKSLPKQMMDDFKKVDFIIHAGDFCGWEDYEALAKIKEVKAVYGNMDTLEIRQRFPRKQIINYQNYQIGLFHGEGPPPTLLEKVKEEFRDDRVDVIIFGHSHQPFNEKIGKILFFNPGSPNDEIFAPYCSYGILEIFERGIEGKLIKVKKDHG